MQNETMKLRKLKTGNHFGYYNGYYISIFKRPHGGWCVFIGKKGKWIWSEGKFTTSLKTIKAAKQWAKFHVDPMCRVQWID